MAKKLDEKKIEEIKPNQKQKIIVAQGRALSTPYIPFMVLHTETVESNEIAKKRVQELKEEYKNVGSLSVSYFSV